MIAGVEVTVGSDSDPAAQAVNAMGGKHIAKKVTVSYPVTPTHGIFKLIMVGFLELVYMSRDLEIKTATLTVGFWSGL